MDLKEFHQEDHNLRPISDRKLMCGDQHKNYMHVIAACCANDMQPDSNIYI